MTPCRLIYLATLGRSLLWLSRGREMEATHFPDASTVLWHMPADRIIVAMLWEPQVSPPSDFTTQLADIALTPKRKTGNHFTRCCSATCWLSASVPADCRGRALSTAASCSGRSGLSSRPGDQVLLLRLVVFLNCFKCVPVSVSRRVGLAQSVRRPGYGLD